MKTTTKLLPSVTLLKPGNYRYHVGSRVTVSMHPSMRDGVRIQLNASSKHTNAVDLDMTVERADMLLEALQQLKALREAQALLADHRPDDATRE